MSYFEKGNPLNYKIKAKKKWSTGKGAWYDCEGDREFFSDAVCDFDEENGILEIPEWLYNKKFRNGNSN